MKTLITLLFIVALPYKSDAQTTAIPDSNFEQALINLGFDSGSPDGVVLTANIDTIGVLNVSFVNISSLVGIEDFTNLSTLYCEGNLLTNLDVSQNTALNLLYCSNNQLTNIVVAGAYSLTLLHCNNNQLSTINITQNVALNNLSCKDNLITNLDVSQNTDLNYLNCNENLLTNINVTQNTALISFLCDDNQLSNIDVTQNIVLDALHCNSNQLTNLNVTQNTTLTELECSYNQLTSLDLTQNIALTELHCYYNQITSLDVSKNTALTYLHCAYNQITNLNVDSASSLTKILCYNNILTTLDVSQNNNLFVLHSYNNQLTSLDVSKNSVLSQLFCSNNPFTCLNVKNGNNTNFTTFISTNTPNLTCIDVDNVAYSTINWSNIDASVSFSNNCINSCSSPLNIGNDTSICQGDSLFLDFTTPNATYLWQDSSTNSTYTITNTGTYWIEITANNTTISDTINILVNPLPNVILAEFNPDTLCNISNSVTLPSGSPSGGSYTGYGVVGNNFDPTISGLGTHNIIYTYTDGNSCINSDTSIITVENCTGIDNIKNDFGIIFYPNPNIGQFAIEKTSNLNKEIKVQLLDIASKLILEIVIPIDKQKLEIDITKYSKGIYYLHLNIDDEQLVKQILKN